MNVFSSFLLGLVQGVAEFLPISSSGHLAIAQNLLQIDAEVPEFFDVLLHLGTLGAVFVAYWQDIKDMIAEFFRGIGDLAHRSTPKPLPPARRLILLIVLGTLPLFAVLPIKDKVLGLSNNMLFIGGALVVTGFLLFASDRVKKGRKNERTASLLDAVAVGVGQAIATVPGISRSGMTITSGCFVGFERKFAVRFSFLLSIPAVLGANILSLKDAISAGVDWGQVPVYLVGVLTAAVSGYLCIGLLRRIANKGKFGAFAYYCWAMGLLTIVLQLIKLENGFVMASGQKKKTTGKARQGGGQSRQTSRSPQKNPRPPIRREVGGGVCLLLALCVVVSYFQADAIVLNLLGDLLKGLTGYGYWLAAPALALAGVNLLAHRGRPVALRTVCTLVTPVLLGAILHLFLYQGETVTPMGCC